MTPAELTARIDRVAGRTYLNTHHSGFVSVIGRAAAREALICAQRDMHDYREAARTELSPDTANPYRDGWNEGFASAMSRVNRMLTALQGGDDGTEGTDAQVGSGSGSRDGNGGTAQDRTPASADFSSRAEVTPSLVAPEDNMHFRVKSADQIVRDDPQTASVAPEEEIARLTAERDEYRTLAGIGVWHKDCRPNRHMAVRELAKSQAVINKLADEIARLKAEQSPSVAPEGEKTAWLTESRDYWEKAEGEARRIAAEFIDKFNAAQDEIAELKRQLVACSDPPSLVSPAPQEEQQNEDARSDQPQLRAGESDPRGELVTVVRAFLAKWDLAAPKINNFINLAAVRANNFGIYDGPNMGVEIDRIKELVGYHADQSLSEASPSTQSAAPESSSSPTPQDQTTHD
jgi:hypothetical protein